MEGRKTALKEEISPEVLLLVGTTLGKGNGSDEKRHGGDEGLHEEGKSRG